jgi:Ran GTPase-activating protein (RanGAP) involved in mRNA processing and transport
MNSANPPLRVFDVCNNHISDKGAIALKELFKFAERLTTIKISNNKINTKGGIAIAEAISENKNVRFLEASFNCFGHSRNGKFAEKMA